MGIKYTLAASLNAVLRPLGARLQRDDAPEPWQMADLAKRHAATVRQLHALFRESHPQLPATPGRDELLSNLVGTQVGEALWLIRSLHDALSVPGDVCEFGIAEGATSALLANEIRATEKRLWLFDSFQGLSQPTVEDVLIDDIFQLGSMDAYTGKMSYPVEEVRKRLTAIDFPKSRVQIVPGYIEQSIQGPHLPQEVAFAYVDFDFYEPILVALRFLRQVMPVGGRIVVDDYGFFSAGAQRAVDEFVDECQGEFTLRLPPPYYGHFAELVCERSSAG
ncbi:MAG: TylF/MycF/NovP-related O-methyltransferase [Pirellulales bacterium]